MLTVPILVYVLRVEAQAVIFFPFILVGSTALLAALLHQRRLRVAWKKGLLFIGFSTPLNLLGAYVSRCFSGARCFCCLEC